MMECIDFDYCLLGLLALLGVSLYFNLRLSMTLRHRKDGDRELIKGAYFHPITQLPNRLNMDIVIEEQIERSKRHGTSFVVGVVMIKNYNQKFISTASNCILDSLRDEDVLGHIDNETFLILFNEYLNEENFEIILSRIKAKFDKVISDDEGESFKFDVSIGHSVYPKDGLQIETLMERAKNSALK